MLLMLISSGEGSAIGNRKQCLVGLSADRLRSIEATERLMYKFMAARKPNCVINW